MKTMGKDERNFFNRPGIPIPAIIKKDTGFSFFTSQVYFVKNEATFFQYIPFKAGNVQGRGAFTYISL